MEYKQMRIKRGLSAADVVEAVKLVVPWFDAPMLSRIENGRCLPNDETRKALLSVLQVDETGDSSEDKQDSEKDAERFYANLMRQTIPHGRENAISRSMLSIRLGVTDRQARKAVELARAGGLIIVNAQDGKGYYQTDDLKELRKQYKQDTARAMRILSRRKPLRDKLISLGEKVR